MAYDTLSQMASVADQFFDVLEMARMQVATRQVGYRSVNGSILERIIKGKIYDGK